MRTPLLLNARSLLPLAGRTSSSIILVGSSICVHGLDLQQTSGLQLHRGNGCGGLESWRHWHYAP